MPRTRNSNRPLAKYVARNDPKSSLEKARSLLNYGLSKIQTKVWFLIARTAAEANLPTSICKALDLDFDDVLALLLQAGILFPKKEKDGTTPDGTRDDRMNVNTDEIDTLNFQFLNLAIKHTYTKTTDARCSYKTLYFIGRGKLGPKKAVYGAAVAKIKTITYSESQQEQIAEIRKQVETNYPLLFAALKAADEESLYVDTGFSRTDQAECTGMGAALITPTEADQQLDSLHTESEQNSGSVMESQWRTAIVTPTNASEMETPRHDPNATRDAAR